MLLNYIKNRIVPHYVSLIPVWISVVFVKQTDAIVPLARQVFKAIGRVAGNRIEMGGNQ